MALIRNENNLVIYFSRDTLLCISSGLKSDEKIVVFWTKEICLPHFNRYRLKFRKVYSGNVMALN